MSPAGKGPIRFRRTGYNPKGNYSSNPRWHRATREMKKGEYKQLVGLCGYTVPPSIALFLGYDLSKAVVPKNGELCEKCEKVAADEEKYLKKNPPKEEGRNE
jgi:hypothetical protein